MNKTFIETDENNYIVIENANNVSLVKADKNIEEVLNLESDLECTDKKIKSIFKQIKKLRKDKKDKRFINCSLIISEIIVGIIGFSNPANILFTLVYMLFVIVVFKVPDMTIYDSFDKINKKIHKLSLEKEILLVDYKEIQDKLYRAQYVSNYTKENLIDTNNINYTNEKELETKKVKKLVLTKPNKD